MQEAGKICGQGDDKLHAFFYIRKLVMLLVLDFLKNFCKF